MKMHCPRPFAGSVTRIGGHNLRQNQGPGHCTGLRRPVPSLSATRRSHFHAHAIERLTA